ncbi:MAG: biotin--[acetyl-CoA-carboxylase] ligase [Spirochaetota bacterium]
MNPVAPLSVARLLAIANPLGGPVWLFAETTSTQDEARSMAAAGTAPGTAVVANRQSAGRGRLPGRKWLAEPGEALLCTLILDPAWVLLPALPLRIGLALAEACEAAVMEEGGRIGISVKWPNDLMFQGEAGSIDRKLGGILCETGSGLLLAGFGINLATPVLPAGTAAAAGLEEALPEAQPGPGGRKGLRERLLAACLAGLARLPGREDWHLALTKRLWMRGRECAFEEGRPGSGARFVATIIGIGPEGQLLTEAADGKVKELLAGEISIAKPGTGALTPYPSIN